MSFLKKLEKRSQARKFRNRNKIARVNTRAHKVVVFRSSKHIYASLVEVETGRCLFGYSSLNEVGAGKDKSCNNKEIAKSVGATFGKVCLSKGISEVAFDRGPYLYPGKVASLAEGIREAGVII